jgi:hypothetical protein
MEFGVGVLIVAFGAAILARTAGFLRHPDIR